jgi:hypothetical protein
MSNKTDIYNQDKASPNPLPQYIDRSREQKWLIEHGKEFAGQWVALDGDRLLSHGNNAQVVYAEAKKSGINRPLVIQVEIENELPFGGW